MWKCDINTTLIKARLVLRPLVLPTGSAAQFWPLDSVTSGAQDMVVARRRQWKASSLHHPEWFVVWIHIDLVLFFSLFMSPNGWTRPRGALSSDFAGSSFTLILQVLTTLTVCLFLMASVSLFYTLIRLSGSGLDSPSLKPAAAFAHQPDSSRWREIQLLLCLFVTISNASHRTNVPWCRSRLSRHKKCFEPKKKTVDVGDNHMLVIAKWLFEILIPMMLRQTKLETTCPEKLTFLLQECRSQCIYCFPSFFFLTLIIGTLPACSDSEGGEDRRGSPCTAAAKPH